MEQVKFSFNFYPRKYTKEGTLVLYLNNLNSKMFEKKVKVIQAVSAYWLPFACEWAGHEKEEVKRLALSSINKLQLHIQHLREVFDLPSPESSSAHPNQETGFLAPMSNRSPKEKIVERTEECSSALEERTDYSDEEESFLSSL